MLYYTFNLSNIQRELLSKNDDSEFTSKINAAIGEVNYKLDGKAFALVSSVTQKGRKLRCCTEILDYSIPPKVIGKMINDELDEEYTVDNVTETTLSRFDSLADDAFNYSLAHRQLPDGLMNSDEYSGIFRRGYARESLIRKKTSKKTATKNVIESWKHINGLSEEIERIFQVKTSSYKGNPVHYAIEVENTKDRTEIRNLLVSCLLEQNRTILRRITEIKLNTVSELSTERIAEFLELQKCGIVVVCLYKSFDGGDSLDDMHQAMDNLIAQVQGIKRDVLFIFEFSKAAEPSWKYIKGALKEINFIELKETNLSNEESRNFIDKLAAADNITDRTSLLGLIEESSYSVGDLKAIYSSWYDKHLCSSIYPAYSDFSVYDVNNVKQTQGNAYQKLSNMIGLDDVRAVITSAIDYSRVQSLYEKAGIANSEMTRHMVFYGNPGTAKTTCARLYAQIMKDNGLLKKGHLIEVGRKDIVSKYLGGTAPLIKEYFEKADGGVLFIDEAYSLVDDKKGLYGDEAINTIVQEMENKRDSVVVILAGYPEEMETFLARNPGLRSRISFHVHFRDYTSTELLSILKLFVKEAGMDIEEAATPKLMNIFDEAIEQKDFGNGRFARNLFEQARLKQASRVLHIASPSDADIRTLTATDFIKPERRKGEQRKQIGFVF